MARAITLTGQYIIKTVGDGLNHDLGEMLNIKDYDWSFYSDTDSVVGSSIITVNGEKLTISDFYDNMLDNFVKYDSFNDNYVKIIESAEYATLSLSKCGVLETKSIAYVMKHKVKKELFKIKNSNGDEVVITQDHSIIVEDKFSGLILNIKPKFLNSKKYRIISIVDTGANEELEFDDNYTITSLGIVEEWVYDIEVEDNHNFFANNILVHNSCYITLKPMVEKYYKDVPDEKLVSIIDKIAKEKITPIINKHCLDLQTYTNAYRNMISFKQESISKNGVFCCHPDTTIVINGQIITISVLYDISLDGIVDSVILSYDVFNSIFECDIVEEVLRRDYSGYMYEFYLENGECLKVTSEHVIIVNRCGVNCEVKAKDILESDEFISI